MKRYLYIFCSCFYLLFLFSEKASAQACSATWNLNSSTTPAITGAITASSPPSFGGGLLNTGTGDPNYGSYGNNWPTSSTVPTPSTSTKYIQFSVTPTCGTLTLTSINFNSYNNEGVPPDYVAVFWSTSSTFATSTSIVTNLSTPSGANNYTNNALASVNCAAGQTIYFRVYFYYAGSTSVYFGIKNMILSGSTGSCCAAPSTQASSLSFSGVSCGGSSITANWTRGNGNDVMVVVTAGGASTGPSSGTAYTANTVYGSGTACGGGYVVYNGTGTSVTVTGLTAGTTYYFDIYEYNTAGTCYLTTSLESSTSIPNNNDNWACATTLTVGAAATSGSTAGATLQANESTGCNSVAAGQLYTVDQSVWYKFVASATTNYVQITQLTGCYNTFGAVAWDPSVVSASNGSTYQTTNINGAYCGMLNCQGGYGNNAASNPFLFELCNLTIGNTYYMQIVNSSSSCGASATFSISVSGSNPGGTITNPCHPAGQGANSALSPIAECYINACATAPGCPSCTTYSINGATGSNQNNIVWNSYYSFTTAGGCSNDLEFQQCVVSTQTGGSCAGGGWCGSCGNVSWLSFQLYNTTGGCITSGDFSTNTDTYGYLGLPGVGCNTSYVLQYTSEQLNCTYYNYTPFTDNYGSSTCVLPIVLTRFAAKSNSESNVDVIWTTATEKNNSHFTLERSTDGQNFTPIYKVKASGNTVSSIDYLYTDTAASELAQNVLYYRLSQTDFDGSTNYFNIVEVNIHKNFSVSVYPNPSSGDFNLDYVVPLGNFMQIDMSDATGNLISSKMYVGSGGLLHQKIEPPQPGIYFMSIRVNGQVVHKKLVKL